jgi:hypothetical protein
VTEFKCAHVRALKPNIEAPVGHTFWAMPTRARQLIEKGAGELVNASMVPRETMLGILERSKDWPLNRLSTVRRQWAGGTAVIIAGGPSLTLEQVAAVRVAREADRVRVIAVNDAYLWAPWADVLYASDSSWWRDHARGIPKPMLKLSAEAVRQRFDAFPGERCGIQDSGSGIEDTRVHLIRNARTNPQGDGIHADGLSLAPDALLTGRNSGWQALNLSVLAGASTVILLGFDGQAAKDGRSHWSGGHREPTPEAAYAAYRQSFSAAENALKAAGIRVVNCSPGSAIDAFPKMPIDQALDT